MGERCKKEEQNTHLISYAGFILFSPSRVISPTSACSRVLSAKGPWFLSLVWYNRKCVVLVMICPEVVCSNTHLSRWWRQVKNSSRQEKKLKYSLFISPATVMSWRQIVILKFNHISFFFFRQIIQLSGPSVCRLSALCVSYILLIRTNTAHLLVSLPWR